VNTEPQDPVWERLSKAIFGACRTEDEGLFTYRVMQEIRELQPALRDIAWRRFLRWAIPVLGVGVASLVLATRTPSLLADDPVNVAMEDF